MLFHNDSLDYLERRLDRIENLSLEGSEEVDRNENRSILERLQVLESKIPELDSKIPELQPILNNMQKILPLLSVKRNSVRETIEYLSKVASQKEEIQNHIQSLQIIRNLSQFINKENYTGILSSIIASANFYFYFYFLSECEMLSDRLGKLEFTLSSLQPKVASQMKEIDDLIEIYEQGVRS